MDNKHTTYQRTNCSARLSGGNASLYLVRDRDEVGRWRWIYSDGSDTGIGGATKDGAVRAAEAAWAAEDAELGIHIGYSPDASDVAAGG